MAGELKHKSVGTELTQAEFEAINGHTLDSGVEGDFIYWDATNGCFKRIAHTADLDAHMADLFQTIRTGEYWANSAIFGTTTALVANVLYAVPLFIARPITIDRLALQITGAGAGGTKARLGIYNNGTNLYPGTLLLDAGEVAADGVATVAAMIAQALTRGIFWLAVISDGTPTIRTSHSYQQPTMLMGVAATNFASPNVGWNVAQAYGALPSTFTAGGTATTSNRMCIPRILSLD